MQPDFSKWAVVAHKDDTGFGRQAEDMRAVLGIDRQIVIPSERLSDKPLDVSREIMLRPEDPVEKVHELLADFQGIIFYERHHWHPSLLAAAKKLGVRTVCVVNWEWFDGNHRAWDDCDLFVVTSQFALSIVRGFHRNNSIVLPWTIDMLRFPKRSITGTARVFVHNAGIIDPDDRKGTRDTIRSFKLIKNEELRLLVRMQKQASLPTLDERIDVRVDSLHDPADLYAQGDVAIQPSKMEGNGFMVLEAVCSGMPVITLDYPPMSEFVRQPEMRVRKRWFKRRAFPTTWIKHAHLRLPDLNDLARKISWCAEHDLSAISKDNRAWAENTFDRNSLRHQWKEAIGSMIQ